ncbi:MAG: HAD family hydrolase [Actinobacteria bacterium]|uniref:HAD family hydrolase n=1 Tax=Candidatus Fonsibacter lacus TaxID=2576439 RepID=A0A965GDP8_9PROT|nr:HAD family hydrolase [Candidatus Fonsibacter lacus]
MCNLLSASDLFRQFMAQRCDTLEVREQKPVALFDLDNTLIQGSSLYLFLRGLVHLGEISRKQLIRFALHHYKFLRTKTENRSHLTLITQRGLELVKGYSQSHLMMTCEKIVTNFILPRVNPVTLAEVQHHQRNGIDTWVVTAAPTDLATLLARHMGMTGAIGTEMQTEEGRYSGKLIDGLFHGPRKAQGIKLLAEKHEYNLRESFAYSDSINDLPLLLSVGKPCVVNANAELLRIARKNAWRELSAAG